MRILVATDAWRPQVNGVVRSLETMAQSARALGAEIDFLTPRDFNSLPMPTYPEIALALASPRAVRRRLEDGYDHVHIATEGPIGLVTRAVLLRARRCFHHELPHAVPRIYPGAFWASRRGRLCGVAPLP